MLLRVAATLACAATLAACGGGGAARDPARAALREAGYAERGRRAYEDGRFARALAYFEKAQGIARSLDDREAVGAHIANRALALRALGRTGEARAALDGLIDFPAIYSPRAVLGALRVRALLFLDDGDLAGADADAESAAALCRETSCADVGAVLALSGRILFLRGDHLAALYAARSARERSAEGSTAQADALRVAGDALLALGEPIEAGIEFMRALEIDKGLGRTRMIALDLGGLGDAACAVGDRGGAAAYYARRDETAPSPLPPASCPQD
jgi:tetratricopeptide (TPR) repeat protein